MSIFSICKYYIYIYIYKRSNYTRVTLPTITPFYNFQLNNVFVKFTIELKVFLK